MGKGDERKKERWFIITIVVWRGSGKIVRSREEGEEGGGEGDGILLLL